MNLEEMTLEEMKLNESLINSERKMTYEMEQIVHEIEWLKKKIASLPSTKGKQIRDLHRQILEREFTIVFQKESKLK